MMKVVALAVCLAAVLTGVRCTNSTRPGTSAELRSVTAEIDPLVIPGGHVDVSVEIFAFYLNLCPEHETMTVRIVLRQGWTDDNLAHGGEDNLMFDGHAQSSIWVPDTFFTSALKVKLTDDPTLAVVKIGPDGRVSSAKDVIVTTPCNGVKRAFRTPGTNRVTCSLTLESFKHGLDHLTLGFLDASKAIIAAETPGESVAVVDTVLTSRTLSMDEGNHSSLEWKFIFDVTADWLTVHQ